MVFLCAVVSRPWNIPRSVMACDGVCVCVCRVACDDVDDARVMAFAWREYANHASRRVFVLDATARHRVARRRRRRRRGR